MAMIPAVRNRCCCILSGRTRQEESTRIRIRVEARAKRGLSESAMRCHYLTCQVAVVKMYLTTYFQIIFFSVPLARSIPESVCVNYIIIIVDQYTCSG